MRYTAGDTVVHPRHGIATVQSVDARPGTGYLELYFEAKGMTIKVPVDALDTVGVRSVSTPAEAAAILDVMRDPSDVPSEWSQRSTITKARMQSAELDQAAMVVRDLTRHAARLSKRLSATEQSALDTCLDTVSLELSLAMGISQAEAGTLVLEAARTRVAEAASA